MKKETIILMLIVAASLLLGGCATGQAKGGKPGKPGRDIYQCNDGVDNDGDGQCDFEGCTVRIDRKKVNLPADTDCTSATDDNEATECTPSAEVCDGVDNDCDNNIDEDLGLTTCGLGLCQMTTENCIGGVPQVCAPGSPGIEVCNSIDDDCDGSVDDNLARSCGVSDVGECELGTETCSNGQWSICIGAVYPRNETCDGADNDCDGVVDDGCACVHGDTKDCGTAIGSCELGQQTCLNGQWSSCVGEVPPGQELCDGADNDCDGLVDENSVGNPLSQPCSTGLEGLCGQGTQYCQNGGWDSCVGSYQPTAEICDDYVDNDCNGLVDDGCSTDDCSDTDGGIDIFEWGMVYGTFNSIPYNHTDYCPYNNTLVEYYCDNGYVRSTGYMMCNNTMCLNGRCI